MKSLINAGNGKSGGFDASQWEVIGANQAAAQQAAPAFDAANWEVVPDAPMGAPKAGPSKTESFLRGGWQGVTFGLGDELTGGIESLFTDKSYQQARDESRAANAAAKAANPLTYGAGEIGGGIATAFVPGVGLAKGAGLAAKVGLAAAEGGAAGFGYSEGKDLETIAKDTVAGAALGAAGGAVFAGVDKGLAKLVASSPERASKRIVQEIVSTTNPTQRNKLLGEGGKNAGRIGKLVLEDPDLLKAYRDPTKLQNVVRSKLAAETDKLAPIYESVDQVSRGVDAADVWSAVDVAAKKYKDKFRGGVADMIQKKADDLSQQIGGSKHLTASQMRDVVASFQDDAFAGSFINPTAAKKAMREVSGELREILNSHVEKVASTAKIANGDSIRRINQRVSDLVNLKDVVERAATRAEGATKVAPFSLKNASMLASNPLALVGLGASDSPTAAVALGGAQVAGKLARAADDKLGAAVLAGTKPSLEGGTQVARRLTATEGAAGVARGRASLSDLAAMAQQGAPPNEIEAAGKEAGIAPSAVKRLIQAFAPQG